MMKNLIEFAEHIKNIFISTDFLENPDDNWLIKQESITLESGTFLSEQICNDITRLYNMKHEKTLTYKGIEISYSFYDKRLNKKYAKFFVGYLCFLINLLDSYGSLTKKLKLILINYDGKKYIPDDDIFKSIHVNSGLTYCYSDEYAEIIIYRKEEMAKVLIHEMIHFYNIDSKYVYGEEKLNNFFCLNGKNVNVNEAFTETFACLINIVIYTILQKKQTLLTNLVTEQKHSRSQAYKVLKIAKFNTNCINKNKESTHAISYYVIKSILIDNVEDFLYYLKKNNFRLKDKNNFIAYVSDKLKGIDYTTFGKIEYKSQKNKKSMRMTILDTVDLMSK